MDASKVGRGAMIAAGSAVVLFILMFLNWFGASADTEVSDEDAADLLSSIDAGDIGADSVGFNAWEVFSLIDIILLVAIVVAVGLAVATAMSQTVNLPVAASAVTAGLGILATLLILYRVIDTPYGLDREFWLFLGLIAAAGIAYGGWRSMEEEGTSFGDQADRLGGDRTPPPPASPPPAGPAA